MPLSVLRQRKLRSPLLSMAKNMAPSGARNAFTIGCGVQSFAGASKSGSVIAHVAPLLVETAILKGSQSEFVQRPPPKKRTVLPSVHNSPDWSFKGLKSQNNSGGSHCSAP